MVHPSTSFLDIHHIASLEMRDFVRHYLSTGSPLVDLVIGMIIFRLIVYFTQLAETPLNLPLWFCFWRAKEGARIHKSQLEFEFIDNNGGGLSNPFTDFSPGYKGIMHKMSEIQDERVWKLRETRLNNYDETLCRYNDELLYEVCQDNPIEVVPDVFVVTNESDIFKPNPAGKGQSRQVTRHLILYSDSLAPHELRELVDEWSADYDAYKRRGLQKSCFIFQVRFGNIGSQEISVSEFHSFRSFENFHFEQKQHVLNELEFFISRKDWYEEQGLPYTLGILCYGEPGCGKTSFIKALLQYTKRHAIVFSINRYTSLETVEQLMRTDRIENLPIPQEDRIYVLEDVDAMGDLVRNRSDKEEPIGPKPFHTEALKYLGKHKKDKTKNESLVDKKSVASSNDDVFDMLLSSGSKKPENNLSFLLNILDGVIEIPGRIIVMTTNFINKLDPALIRPGRIDLKLEFARCKRQLITQILSQFYDIPIEEIKLPDEIEDHLLTPARVAQLCRGHKRSIHVLIEELVKASIVEKEKKTNSQGIPQNSEKEKNQSFWEKLSRSPDS